jgi:antitoxin FitA
MVSKVVVPDLDEAVVEALRRRADARGVSLEEQLRDILTAAAKPSKGAMIEVMRRIRARARAGEWPPVEDLVRADRDRR